MEQKPEAKKKVSRNKLVLNISQTKYELLRDIAKDLKFKVSTDPEPKDFDLFWTDMAVQPE